MDGIRDTGSFQECEGYYLNPSLKVLRLRFCAGPSGAAPFLFTIPHLTRHTPFQGISLSCSSSEDSTPIPFVLLGAHPDGPPSQHLAYARKAARDGELLPADHAAGPHGDRFWGRVTLGTPGRTQAECLDAFLAASPLAASTSRSSASRGRPA